MCACLIHFEFESKVSTALSMMKFAGTHSSRFEFAWISFAFGLFQFTAVIFVEIVNIVNLTYIGNIMDLVINYVTLGVIMTFDDNFYEMYKRQNFSKWIEYCNDSKAFVADNFLKTKVKISYASAKEAG